MSKVSVIVPIYNAERTLRRCVDSILKQDYPDFELILVNDGSQDASAQIASEYAAADSRVRAITKENGGVSSARNLGLTLAGGEYVQFVDADDWLPLEAVKLLVREMEQRAPDLVVGDFFRVFEGTIGQKGSIEKGGLISRRQYADEMMKSPADLYYGVLWNKLYRRSLIEQHHVRMEEQVAYGEDMIFNLEYLLHAETIAVLKAPVYYYIRVPGSLVEQHISLNGIMNMKRTVIRYYDQFYRQIFDEQTYQDRRLIILSYYLAFSTDAVPLPLIGGTRPLGRERGADVPFARGLEDSLDATFYLTGQLADRYMETLAGKHDLTLNEMHILYLLWRAGVPCTMEEIGHYTGLGKIALTMLMVRLGSAGLVARKNLDGKKSGYVFAASQLAEELSQLETDYKTICFDGFSEEERAAYEALSRRLVDNIRRRIVQDGGKD